jgi:HK97 family phage major capsid protein
MEIDDKKLAETIATAAKEAVEQYKAKDITRKIPAGNVEVVQDEVDKITSDKKGGFKSFGHYLKDLITVADKFKDTPETLKNWQNAVQKTAGTMEEGDLAQGGYRVPVGFGEAIFQQALEESVVRGKSQFQPIRNQSLKIVADVDSNHQTNFFGGVTIYRSGEGGQITASNPTYQQIQLTLHKVTGLCHVTSELIEDSDMAVEADVTRKFSQAIAFTMDDDFINGNGSNKPLGMLNSGNPALITVTAVSGQGASTIVADNIIDMYYRMYPQGVKSAVWLANYDTFPQLVKLVLSIGTAGVPLWMPANGEGLVNAPNGTLFGRPLILTEKCQALGTAGDIAFVDFSKYIVAGKANNESPTVATSIHLKFDYDMQSFRFVMRYDGQPLWVSPLTPKYSSTTVSPFIVLSSTRT